MIPRLAALVLALACCVTSFGATVADFTGTWTWYILGRNAQPDTSTAQFTLTNGALTGTLNDRTGTHPIINIVLAGDQLTFATINPDTPLGNVTILYTLTIAGAVTVRTPVSGLPSGVQTKQATANHGATLGAPQITGTSGPGSVTAGFSATLNVWVGGDSPFRYEWKKNGTVIAGATSGTYIINITTAGDAGSYTCTVSNNVGSVTTTPIVLTITAPPPTTPTVSAPPIIPIPQISAKPTIAPPANNNLAASIGDAITLAWGATGEGPISYQWRKDGIAIPGATSGSYAIGSVRRSDAGEYTLTASNAGGTTTSSPITLKVIVVPPAFTTQPLSASVIEGAPVTLTVVATGNPAPTLQWQRNGAPLPGTTGTSLILGAATLADAGTYTCVASNEAGQATTSIAVLTVHRAARVANFSARGHAASGNFAAGFVIEGNGAVQTLVRAAGPALAEFGIATALPDPSLQILGAGFVVAENDDWRIEHAAVFAEVGAFPFRAGSKDAAVVAPLQPGAFTATVLEREGRSGDILIEVYDASTSGTNGRFVNASAMGFVAPGRTMDSGFVIAGQGTIRVLLRAIGPGLQGFGATNVLSRPQIALARDGLPMAQNAGWTKAPDPAAVSAAAAQVGAFSLAAGSDDAALIAELTAGSYTVQTSTSDSGGGSVLFELYLVR